MKKEYLEQIQSVLNHQKGELPENVVALLEEINNAESNGLGKADKLQLTMQALQLLWEFIQKINEP